MIFFFFQAEDGIRDVAVTGVQTCALPIWTVVPVPEGSMVVTSRHDRPSDDDANRTFAGDRFLSGVVTPSCSMRDGPPSAKTSSCSGAPGEDEDRKSVV